MRIDIPKTLPECELIRALAAKASERQNIEFDFLGRLNDFRQQVSQQVRQINVLFPEFTPHDEDYHLTHLFHVADVILGSDLINSMYSAELFLLASGLYGHDWGMAVSEVEMAYITTGELRDGARAEGLWILRDERNRFATFMHRQGFKPNDEGKFTDVAIEIWRYYVRETHALRSGERVHRFFEQIDGGVADAASRLCVGHCLDLEDLEDHVSYPVGYPVLRETANVRALTVYLRLIDLLDLAEDRTPYVVWKFVAPRDPFSRIEWEKHRSLRPVTTMSYQSGRIILVNGRADNPEVYAALEDLRVYCEKQLVGCTDVLARMNDPHHKLDIHHIDWQVAPVGFKPILVQFEFDRERMFEILGEEIYQGDIYVFLRELLQNSIDAIRMRRTLLRRKGIEPGTVGTIQVSVEHGNNGDCIVTWRDDGIGMDEYTVRNYLAVAGKSYYTSRDFEQLGLDMDPISKFGIGILSCFMVAQRVEIETFMDPYFLAAPEALKITIPDPRKQFRIETIPSEITQIGTTVRVFVEGRKLPKIDEGFVEPLHVTRYLLLIAGFVEFPIVITEADRKTVIIHPEEDAAATQKRFGKDFFVQQLKPDYPWSDVFLPQDLDIARQLLHEVRWDIATDLGLTDFEGFLVRVMPDDSVDLSFFDREWRTKGIKASSKGAQDDERLIRWTDVWRKQELAMPEPDLSRSCNHHPAYAVYRDGILLAGIAPDYEPTNSMESECLPVPKVAINLPKSQAPRLDLARMEIVGESANWGQRFWEVYSRKVLYLVLPDTVGLDPLDLFHQLGRLIAHGGISDRHLWAIFPSEHFPVPLLGQGGVLTASEWGQMCTERISELPDWLHFATARLLMSQYIPASQYPMFLSEWVGDSSMICWPNTDGFLYHSSAAISRMLFLGRVVLEESHCFASMGFVETPWGGDPPMVQKIWVPKSICQTNLSITEILQKAVVDPVALDEFERDLLRKQLLAQNLFSLGRFLSMFVPFPSPYEESFCYDSGFVNSRHRTAKALLRSIAVLAQARMENLLPLKYIGEFQDVVDSLAFLYNWKYENPAERMEHLVKLAHELQILDLEPAVDLLPVRSEFLSGPDSALRWAFLKDNWRAITKPFGRPLA